MNLLGAVLVILVLILLYAASASAYGHVEGLRVANGKVLLPTNGYEPIYNPFRWNLPPMVNNHNCYDYAFNNYDPTQVGTSQPGEIPNSVSEALGPNYNCADTEIRLHGDQNNTHTGLDMQISRAHETCPAETYKIALVMDPDDDYHFLRQNRDGTWSHKPGTGAVMNKDFSGNVITDPRTANMKNSSFNYDRFCNFFCVSTDAHKNFKRTN